MGDQIARAEEFEKKAEKNFKDAIEIYEEIARHSHNCLLKYRVKCHLLNAGICHLCKSDIVAITNALERYQEMDPTFSGTREYRLLATPAEVVVDFWKTTLLLRLKEKVKAKELEEDDLT